MTFVTLHIHSGAVYGGVRWWSAWCEVVVRALWGEGWAVWLSERAVECGLGYVMGL